MSESQKSTNNSNKAVLIAVALVIIAVIGYAIWQQSNNKNGKGNDSVHSSDSLEITGDKLAGTDTKKEPTDFSESTESADNTVNTQETESEQQQTSASAENDSTVTQTDSSDTSPAMPPEEDKSTETTEQSFSIPADILSCFSAKLTDLYGYIPEPTTYYQGPGAALYDVPGSSYTLLYSVDTLYDDVFPIAVFGGIEDMIPGKDAYSYFELKEILGEKLGEFYENQALGNYQAVAEIDGYSIYFSGADAVFTSFQIYIK